jgi:hypothetical protein
MSTPEAPLTPDIVGKTPAVESAKPVTFTPEQQTKLDEIVKAAMGRAAAETRQKLSLAETELAATKAKLEVAARANAADATEAEKHAAQLQERDLKIKELEQSARRTARENTILAAARAENFVDPDLALRLVDIADDATPEQITRAVHQFAASRDYLIRGTTKSGSGSGPDRGAPPAPVYQVEQVFGPKSDARLANKLSLTNPSAYKALRLQAKQRGLVA